MRQDLSKITVAEILKKCNRKGASATNEQLDNTGDYKRPSREELVSNYNMKKDIVDNLSDIQLNVWWNCLPAIVIKPKKKESDE